MTVFDFEVWDLRESITRPQLWQYGVASPPGSRYSGGGMTACFEGRDQESIQLILKGC